MRIVLLLVALGGWTLACRDYFKLRLSSALFAGVQVLILTIYVFALADLLLPGLVACEVIGILYFGFSVKRSRTTLTASTYLNFFMYLLPFIIFFRAVPKDFRFTMSDEFPSWAANIKTMFLENSLGGINSATREIANGFYQSYPPFQQIFQYLFLKNTHWSEANTQVAQNILVLLSLLGVSSFLTTKKPNLALFTWFGSIAIYYLFGFTMSNLLADGLLAVQFAAALGVLALERKELKVYLLQGIVIANLILIKPTGFIFAFCAIVFAVSNILFKTASQKNPQRDLNFSDKIGYFCKSAAFVIFPAVISYLSWQIHLRIIEMTPGVEGISFSTIRTPEFKNRWSETFSSYKDNFFGSLHGPDNLAGITMATPRVVELFHISLFSIILVLAIVHSVIALTENHYERRSALATSLLFIALSIFYQLFLIFLYMFFFGEYEGVRSAALVRYSSSFLLAWAFFVFGLVIVRISKLKIRVVLYPIIAVTLFLIAPASFSSDIQKIDSNPTKLAARLDVEKVTPSVLEKVGLDKKTYFIYQKSDGFEKYIFSYLILPRTSNWVCPSLGAPYYEGDVWACPITLPDALKGYDFLAIGNGDARFWDENAKYLAADSNPRRQGLYRVKFEAGNLRLTIAS